MDVSMHTMNQGSSKYNTCVHALLEVTDKGGFTPNSTEKFLIGRLVCDPGLGCAQSFLIYPNSKIGFIVVRLGVVGGF